jgi:amino acid transporter
MLKFGRTKPTGEAEAVKFGTFGGVFTPSVLTILGVIMFLRFSTVVGQAGLWGALLILLVATAITLFTGLSLSSISTNMRVKGGGAYYLISRSLGVESGGVIAVFLYVAQAVSVTMYVIGFTEAIFSAFPGLGLSFRTVSTITNILVFISVFIGAGWTIRIQYGILAVLLLSIFSFYVGAWQHGSVELLRSNLQPDWTGGHTAFSIFALFFPAVTGIMAGVNMSGDLKEPRRSIPWGTLAAIGFTTVIYAGIAVALAASSGRETLLGPAFVMEQTAPWAPLIYAGVIAATLSSALGSMMGAPRILQAFGRDNVFKWLKWFGRGSGPSSEPRVALVMTFLVAQAGIMAGDLDSVAPIITMFFLITYGSINLACFYETISRNPSFRPTFRLNHWTLALAGAVGCLGIMFLINALWAVIAIALGAGMYVLIDRAEIMVKWGDVASGVAFQRAREALLRLEQEKYHPKNWRPSLLTLSGGAWNRLHLVSYACLLSAERGLVSLAQVITGRLENRVTRQIEAEKLMRKYIADEELPAFPVVVVDENFSDGLKALLQCHGIGGLRPNTILMGWSEDPKKEGVFTQTLRIAKQMNRSILVVSCHMEQEKWDPPAGAINIWWNDARSVPMMVLLGFLVKQNREWRDCPLRILRPVPLRADVENVTLEMTELLSDARITAEFVVLPTDDPLGAVREAMQPSAVLFAGFDPPDEGGESEGEYPMEEIAGLPGDVILVYSAGDVSLSA